MNRQNFLGHLALAITIILVAAFAGQLRRWEQSRVSNRSSDETSSISTTADTAVTDTATAPEVLVRFRRGTSESEIRNLTASLHDRVEDKIESVDGLVAIDDLDNRDPQEVADEYANLTDEVEYAEPNFEISLDPGIERSTADLSSYSSEAGPSDSPTMPDDPMFADQWSLDNTGQREGKAQADISALKAWAKSTGSEDVVVAVLDSGVDYNHQDLTNNIWRRPANMDEYRDDQLGEIDDRFGYDAVDNTGDPMDDNGHGTHCAGIIGADG